MRTFAIVNRKGGVGKTTTAVELAFILATSCKQRVLFIDADSQGNATSMMLASGQYPHGAGLAAALEYHLEHYPDIIWRTDYEGLDIIPAGEDLADYELSCLLGRQTPDFDRLRDLLAVVAEDAYYDTVVIDCPPYYSVSCLSAIAACDSIIIPAGIDAYSTTGMAGLVRQIDNIRQACPKIRVAGVLVTQWRRSSIGEDAVHTLREESPVPIFRTVIRRTDQVVESSWSREPVGVLSPFSAASRDYRTWVAELLGREEVASHA